MCFILLFWWLRLRDICKKAVSMDIINSKMESVARIFRRFEQRNGLRTFKVFVHILT